MKNRYTEIMLEADKGINFEVSKEANGKILIKATLEEKAELNCNFPEIKAGEYAEKLSIYKDCDGNKAVIPPGWVVSGCESENTIWGKNLGLVIYNIPKSKIHEANWENIEYLKKTYSQSVWIPVSLLDDNGIFDEKEGNKFGRRDYYLDGFSYSEFNEPATENLTAQFESIKRYGGFYIARYKISQNLLSVKGVEPIGDISFYKANDLFERVKTEEIELHILYGAEYDTMIEWFLKSGTKTMREVVKISGPRIQQTRLNETGSMGAINNIYDLENNGAEWTCEYYGKLYRVARGSRCLVKRNYNHPARSYDMVGIRYACFIK